MRFVKAASDRKLGWLNLCLALNYLAILLESLTEVVEEWVNV
ncbi:MAG: hypothetical protein V7K46_06785 [Nostoc sp.]